MSLTRDDIAALMKGIAPVIDDRINEAVQDIGEVLGSAIRDLHARLERIDGIKSMTPTPLYPVELPPGPTGKRRVRLVSRRPEA